LYCPYVISFIITSNQAGSEFVALQWEIIYGQVLKLMLYSSPEGPHPPPNYKSTSKDDHMSENKEPLRHETHRLGRIGQRPMWVLALSICIRAIHQVGAAVFLVAYLLDDIPAVPPVYLSLALISGVALLFTEWLRHREIYRELSGLGTFIKLILLGIAFHGLLPQTATVICAFLLASICSHAPKQYRHRLLF
jgi:hypothetical protein